MWTLSRCYRRGEVGSVSGDRRKPLDRLRQGRPGLSARATEIGVLGAAIMLPPPDVHVECQEVSEPFPDRILVDAVHCAAL